MGTIRGFTFTGNIVNGGINEIGKSVLVNNTQPGSSLTFDNCTWIDMMAPGGLVWVDGVDGKQTTNTNTTTTTTKPAATTQVVIQNCLFSDISYQFPFFGVYDESLIIKNTEFKNIALLPDYLQLSCDSMLNSLDHTGGADECSQLVACNGHAFCDIQESCQTNVAINEWLFKSNNATVQIDEESEKCGFNTTSIE